MSFRILSRDEDPDISKKKLTYILPTLKDFLLILDDRRDVTYHLFRSGIILPTVSLRNHTITSLVSSIISMGC